MNEPGPETAGREPRNRAGQVIVQTAFSEYRAANAHGNPVCEKNTAGLFSKYFRECTGSFHRKTVALVCLNTHATMKKTLHLSFIAVLVCAIAPVSLAQIASSTASTPVPTQTDSTSDSLLAAAELPDAPTAQTSSSSKVAAPAADAGQSDGLSLGDLGFTPSQTKANTAEQARLDKRTHMLKVHQRLGLITLVPMYATVLVAGGAKSHFNHSTGTVTITPPSDANVDLHAALGSLTATLYGATAYYAIRAPKIPGVKPKGAIRVHKALVWIHGPGMILTPILGGMALSQEEKGQKVHGIASAHGAVAAVTVLAYTGSIIAVSWPIHLKF